jgi:hypothetical protein
MRAPSRALGYDPPAARMRTIMNRLILPVITESALIFGLFCRVRGPADDGQGPEARILGILN